MDAEHQTLIPIDTCHVVKEGEVLFPMLVPPVRYAWCKLHVPKPQFQATIAPTEEELRAWEDEFD